MNKLSPNWYIKELVSRLRAKPCNDVKKVAHLPCFIQKKMLNPNISYF